MTSLQRKEYSSLYIRQSDRLAGKYNRKIYSALKAQVHSFVNDLRANGISVARSNLYLTVINDQVGQVIKDLHTESGLFFGRKSWREIRNSAKQMEVKAGFALNEKWINDLLNFFAIDLFQTVSNITDTTRNQILQVLTQAVNDGWSIDQIVTALQQTKLLAYRARLIARTELGKAAFAGRQLAIRDSEWETQKEWIAANDHRTRHSHRSVDGDIIDEGKKFSVPTPKGGIDMMIGPGDPTASVANLANCRCSSSIIAKRDERGRLIPKTITMNNLAIAS